MLTSEKYTENNLNYIHIFLKFKSYY